MTIVLPGIPPSKKNSKIIVYNKKLRRPILLPSKEYTAWERKMKKELPAPHNFEAVEVTIKFFPADRHHFDLTNKAESIMDLLVEGQIIKDDWWGVCPSVTLKIGEVDKANPRSVIILDRIDEEEMQDLTLKASILDDNLTDEAIKL